MGSTSISARCSPSPGSSLTAPRRRLTRSSRARPPARRSSRPRASPTLLVREGGKLEPLRQVAYPALRPAPPHLRDPRADGRRGHRPALDEASARGDSARLRGAGRRGGRRLPVVVDRQRRARATPRRADRRAPARAPVTLSHALNPIVREYRRASSTAIDASLKPLMQRHLHGIESGLRAAGFAGELLVATSFGGVCESRTSPSAPIYSVARARRWRRSPALHVARAETAAPTT